MILKIRQLLKSTPFPLLKKLQFKYSSIPPPEQPSKPKSKKQSYISQPTQHSKRQSHYHIGLYGLVFALCFAAIPMYRIFCQHVGLRGNTQKKEYNFKNKKIVNHKKYVIKFTGTPQPNINWQFQPIDKQVLLGTAQTAIVFFRLRNKQSRPIIGFSTYNIYPQEASLYFSKIQCFCFNQQMINPQQQLLLPIFFYLQPQLIQDVDVGRVNEIIVDYQFYQSRNQDLVLFAANQIKKAQQNKKKLAQIRANKLHMTVQEYEEYLENKQLEEQIILPTITDKKIQPNVKESVQNKQ